MPEILNSEHFNDSDPTPSVNPRELGRRALRLMGLSGNFSPELPSIGVILPFRERVTNVDQSPSTDDRPEEAE